jgi:hypothetical protein
MSDFGASLSSLPHIFFKAGAAQLPETLSRLDIERAIDNKVLLNALGDIARFDELYLELTLKAQEAFRRAKRFKSVDRLTREIANFHFRRQRWAEAEP